MFYRIIFLSMVLLFVSSCSSIALLDTSPNNNTLQLGNIGYNKMNLFNSNYQNLAFPAYSAPIKVGVSIKPFTKKAYNAYLKTKPYQSATVAISYSDSITVKPRYVRLELADKITVLNALNSQENKDVKRYLGLDMKAKIISSISLALSNKELNTIMAAEAVFLEESSPKNYVLQLYDKGNKTVVIPFKSGVIFDYQTSKACWKEDSYRQLDIVDLVQHGKCPKGTYSDASRAKQKINPLEL